MENADLKSKYEWLKERDTSHNWRSKPAGFGFLIFGLLIPLVLLVNGFLTEAGLLFLITSVSSLLLLRSASKYSLTPEKKAFLQTFSAIQDLNAYFREQDQLLLEKVIKAAQRIPSGLTTYVGSTTTTSEVLLNSVIAPSMTLSAVLQKRFQLLNASDQEKLHKAGEVLGLVAHYFLNPSAQSLADVAGKADELIPSPTINETPPIPLTVRLGKLPLPAATLGGLLVGITTYTVGATLFQLSPQQSFQEGGALAAVVFAALLTYLSRK